MDYQLIDVEQTSGPNFVSRFNLYPAAEIMGAPAPVYSSAQALSAIEEVAKSMPREFGYEWSGLTLQQKKSEGEADVIFGMAIVFVFLLLAAQYESWALPFAVLLCTPLVVLGTFIGLVSRNFENNVHAQIGLVMLIGLSAKNAILIVEFAKLKREEGKSLVEAALEGAKLRLRTEQILFRKFMRDCTSVVSQPSCSQERSLRSTNALPSRWERIAASPIVWPRNRIQYRDAHRFVWTPVRVTSSSSPFC